MQTETSTTRIFDVSYQFNGHQHDIKLAAESFDDAVAEAKARFEPTRIIAIVEGEEIFLS